MLELFLSVIVLIGTIIALIVAFCLALASAGIAAIIGAGRAIANYFRAAANNLNFKTWTWERNDEPARRSYFFGPGYIQMIETVKAAYANNADTAKWFHTITESYRTGIHLRNGIRAYASLCAYAVDISGTVFVYCAGAVVTFVFAGVHFLITGAMMLIIYSLFSIVWFVDRGYLIIKKISPVCPECKHKCTIPCFVCPSCGAIHKSLVPGPYGILKHRCICGTKISSTFFNGRSKYEAICPTCGKVLASSDSRPLVVQLIGGTGVGKTVFLSAYYHMLKEKLNLLTGVEWSVPVDYVPYFDELDMYFSGLVSTATTFMNSQLYPIIIHKPHNTDRQLSFFDISGEMFDGVSSKGAAQQIQFHYCDGFIFLIDPFCKDSQLTKPEDAGTFFSEMHLESVVSSFLNYLIEIGQRNVSVRCRIPVAVVIGKCDVEGVTDSLSKEIISEYSQRLNYEDWNSKRDRVCRQFLVDIGFSNAIGNLEASFSNIHYFPVSAMGHSQNDEKYEPWGVTEPIDWIIREADKELAKILRIGVS